MQTADGMAHIAYESELIGEVDSPISKDELAAANLAIIDGMRAWIDDMERVTDPEHSVLDKRFLQGYRMALAAMSNYIRMAEEWRDRRDIGIA